MVVEVVTNPATKAIILVVFDYLVNIIGFYWVVVSFLAAWRWPMNAESHGWCLTTRVDTYVAALKLWLLGVIQALI